MNVGSADLAQAWLTTGCQFPCYTCNSQRQTLRLEMHWDLSPPRTVYLRRRNKSQGHPDSLTCPDLGQTAKNMEGLQCQAWPRSGCILRSYEVRAVNVDGQKFFPLSDVPWSRKTSAIAKYRRRFSIAVSVQRSHFQEACLRTHFDPLKSVAVRG